MAQFLLLLFAALCSASAIQELDSSPLQQNRE
jgi:hypothetical protein